MRLCSGAELSIYGQARRTHFSLTSVSKWAWANRGWAWLEGEQGKANSGQTRLVKASRHAGALLTAAPHWHFRSSAAGEHCQPCWHPQGVGPGFRLRGTYSTYVWELQWSILSHNNIYMEGYHSTTAKNITLLLNTYKYKTVSEWCSTLW